jgi:hypothetical protein
MKIKILKSKSNKYWYADKIGEQFVVDFINNDGNYIINNIGTVLKEDSEEVIFDSVVESVISQFRKRSEAGIKKYGVTMDRNDLKTLDWVQSALEEAMDFCIYLEKLKQQLNGNDNKLHQ